MKLTALLPIGLACLLDTAATLLPPHKIQDVKRISLPGQAIFHHADGHDGGGGGSIGSPEFSNISISENITACCGIVYDNPSPTRTQIIRDDCLDLARQVQGDAGFYELTRWSTGEPGQYHALVNSGTCEFGIQRLEGAVGWNQSANDVAVYVSVFFYYPLLYRWLKFGSPVIKASRLTQVFAAQHWKPGYLPHSQR